MVKKLILLKTREIVSFVSKACPSRKWDPMHNQQITCAFRNDVTSNLGALRENQETQLGFRAIFRPASRQIVETPVEGEHRLVEFQFKDE